MTDDDITPDQAPSKGRATPSRKEAEAARRELMKRPLTRKEKALAERKARQELRDKRREALDAGHGKALPPRDRGPARALVRDYVDRRRNVAEYMLPVLLVILMLGFIPSAAALFAVLVLWSVTVLGTVLDEAVMIHGLRKELARRFEDERDRKGCVAYAVLRTTQLRRFRLPKATIARGEPLREHYR